jgi:hypothetical protein
MASFVVWKMSSASGDIWKTVDAPDARAAAEMVCGPDLRGFGLDSEICARVRSLDSRDEAAVLFYAAKSPSGKRKVPAIAEPAAP